MHGDVEGQGVLVGVPVGVEGQGVQLELVVVPHLVLVIVEPAVIQVALIQLIVPDIVVVVVSVGPEIAVVVEIIIAGELDVLQLVIVGLIVEKVVEVLGIQRHIVVRVHLVDEVRLGAGAGALADLDVEGAVHFVVVVAVHGEGELQRVLVGVLVRTERHTVQRVVVAGAGVIPIVIVVAVIQRGIVQLHPVAVRVLCLEIAVVVKVIVAVEFQIFKILPGLLVEQVPEVIGIQFHIVAGVHIVGQLHITGAAGTAGDIDTHGSIHIFVIPVERKIDVDRIAVYVVVGFKIERIQVIFIPVFGIPAIAVEDAVIQVITV